MKAFKKTKVLLASSIITALTGCGSSDDFTPKQVANSSAPAHGGDIAVSLHEKDAIKFVSLLGTPSGSSSGEGVASDADGNYLTVKDIAISTAGPRTEELGETGIEISGNQIAIRPLDIAPMLDTDETQTVTVTYNISDGANSTPRSFTATITGEDFAPVVVGDMVGNFTRDAGVGYIDLLTNVSDADGEELITSNLVASADNPLALSVTMNGTQLDVDVATVESDIPDGQKVTFNYTYTVSDHRFSFERNLTINILGVQDVAGAPLVLNYFKDVAANETDTVFSVDLSEEIQDREGDSIVVSEVMLDGAALPYGYSLDGNVLTIDPHAFFNETPKDSFLAQTISYKVSDNLGNMSDGTPELTVIFNGVETNLITAAMPNPDFEDESLAGDVVAGGNLGGFSAFGWATWWCATPTIGPDYARTGNNGFRFEGRYCHLLINNIIQELPNDQKYAFSYGLQNKLASTSAASNPYVPIYASALPAASPGLDNRFWLGPRYFDSRTDVWMEHVQIVSTADGGIWDGYEGSTISWDILKYADLDGIHYIDDFSVVSFGDYDTTAHDMLDADVGTFEADETISATGGIVEIRDVEGENKLYINTTGETSVTVSLPIQMGAIKTGGRFALIMQAQLTNHDALYGAGNTQLFYTATLTNGAEEIAASLSGITWGANVSEADIIISEDYGRSSDVDWSKETMMLNLTFSEANAEYYIDNVRLIGIP